MTVDTLECGSAALSAQTHAGQAFWDGEHPTEAAEPAAAGGEHAEAERGARGDDVVVVDFAGLGPDAA